MEIPPSKDTVTVRIIDTGTRVNVLNIFVDNPVKGHDRLEGPSLSFLVEHPSGRRILFDHSVRKDYQKLPPAVLPFFEEGEGKPAAKVRGSKDVRDILEEHGVDPKSIEAIVWSHWHWDHTGDPSRFDSSTALVVGPGFSEALLPGYPANPQGLILESDYAGRELKELSFQGPEAVKIGSFEALDYFGDGSFYLLNGTGHTVGHLCALAATTLSPPSYILMGADACHHSGQMRPSKWHPLPASIDPHPLEANSDMPCPGSFFGHLLPDGDKKVPFYGISRGLLPLQDPEQAEQTRGKLQEADGEGNIIVVIAHDPHLEGVVDFFPAAANEFMSKRWHEQARWSFLSDFRGALKR